MQVGTSFDPAMAMNQVARSAERLNQLNQNIVDASQEMSGKLISMNAEAKVSAQQNQSKLDLLA